jgi:hypothetical protein
MYFKKFISTLPEGGSSQLPLTHVTDAFDLRDIIAGGKLDPKKCPVFKKPLLYFFLGRPAYRKNDEMPASSLVAYFPVAFVISPNVVQTAAQIYPFDTGAYEARLYSDMLHHKMNVNYFSLEKDPTAPGKLVAFFFGSNVKYFDRQPNQGIDVPLNELEATAYYNLISYRGMSKRDDRVSAVEIAIDEPLALNAAKVLAVILPNCLVAAPDFGKALADRKIKILPYPDSNGQSPVENTARLYDFAKDFYINEGWL